MQGDTRPVVAIFRLQMFKPSEPFIVAQAGALRGFQPLHLGRARFGAAPCGNSLAIQDAARPAPRVLWNAATRDPAPFLAALNGIRPALVHAHFGVDGAYALPLARRLGVPLVTTLHGFDVTLSTPALLRSFSPYLLNYLIFRRQLAARADLFLCVSEHIRAQALALGFPADRTRLHYIGIDTATAAAAPARGETILHVARLVEKKGTAILIRAFAHLRSQTARLVIIGEGPLRGPLTTLAAALGVAERVAFLGALPNHAVLDQMRAAAMFVLPSVTAANGDTEGLPITILEASAFGLPVVATRHGGIAEAVQDGHTGLLVPERDMPALSSAIDRLLADPALRGRLGIAARARMARDFDLCRQTARLEDHYAELLA